MSRSQDVSMDDPDRPRLPVTVLSGFLGSGKTTVLRGILTNSQGLKVAMIVNDMAALNVDAMEIEKHMDDSEAANKNKKARQDGKEDVTDSSAAAPQADVEMTTTKPKMVALQNGCICCTLREDLIEQVWELANAPEKYDYLVIESTGISEPVPVAQTFCHSIAELQAMAGIAEQPEHNHEHKKDEDGEKNLSKEEADKKAESDKKLAVQALELRKIAKLDTMVTVVDGREIFEVFQCLDNLRDSKWSKSEAANSNDGEIDTDRTIAELLIDQIEFADVILLNKKDLVKNSHNAQVVEKLVAKLNPGAQVHWTEYGKIDVSKLCGTGLFDFDKASASAGWIRELRHGGVVEMSKNDKATQNANGVQAQGHKPESEEYGISSVVFRARRPFVPKALCEILNGFGNLADLVKASSNRDKKFVEEEENPSKTGNTSMAEDGDEDVDVQEAGPSRMKNVSRKMDPAGVFKGVIRSKGKIWLANVGTFQIMWHSVGRQFSLLPGQPFVSAMLEAGYPVEGHAPHSMHQVGQGDTDDKDKKENDNVPDLETSWGPDRNTELVLIGVHLDKERILAALEKALVPEEDFVLATRDKLTFERFIKETRAKGGPSAVSTLTEPDVLAGTGGLKTPWDRFLKYEDPFFNGKFSFM